MGHFLSVGTIIGFMALVFLLTVCVMFVCHADIEEAKACYGRTKSFRHDIKNHIEVVKNLLLSGKLEEAVTYMGDLGDMAEKMSFPCSTNNLVVDILVGNKLGIAKSMG